MLCIDTHASIFQLLSVGIVLLSLAYGGLCEGNAYYSCARHTTLYCSIECIQVVG